MVGQTPQIEPLFPAYRIRILSDEQLEIFKWAPLNKLEKESKNESIGIRRRGSRLQ